jgi:hypothetical protein
MEKALELGVEATNRISVKCTARELVEINMIAEDGLCLKASLAFSVEVILQS